MLFFMLKLDGTHLPESDTPQNPVDTFHGTGRRDSNSLLLGRQPASQFCLLLAAHATVWVASDKFSPLGTQPNCHPRLVSGLGLHV